MGDALCRCGHDLGAHMGTGVAGVSCKTCYRRQLGPPHVCWDWEPAGAMAGPPGLALAIQAMLRDSEPPKKTRLLLDEERAVLKGCADALEELQATRDRLAGLEVYAAELHDLLEQVWELHGGPEGTALWVTQPFGRQVGAALQAGPPARGRAILEEAGRLRVYQRALALQVLAYRRAPDTPAERNALQGLVGIVDGFEATGQITARGPSAAPRVVILATYDLDLGAAQEGDSG